jgi:hypothetical protein
MTSAELRMRLILASVVLKTLEPYAKRYGVDLSLDDVINLFIVAGSAWHFVTPYLKRFFPTEPVAPAKVNP